MSHGDKALDPVSISEEEFLKLMMPEISSDLR